MTGIKAVAAGHEHAAALKNDGTAGHGEIMLTVNWAVETSANRVFGGNISKGGSYLYDDQK